jgi:hypothetical protein
VIKLVLDAEGAAGATYVLERVLVVALADDVDGRPGLSAGSCSQDSDADVGGAIPDRPSGCPNAMSSPLYWT